MRVIRLSFQALLVLAGAALVSGAQKPETPHLAFVTEYIRELSAIENIRASAEREVEQETSEERLMSAIHSSALFKSELRSQVGTLKDMRLNGPDFDQIIPTLIRLYEIKFGYYQRIIDISSAFLAGPKRGVDYGKMLAEVPQIRAALEDIDRGLFDTWSPLIFMTLTDLKPDSQNRTSHLIITQAERTNLLDELDGRFGAKLDRKDQNYVVSAAKVLRDFLKDHKCSDDPWE